MSSYIVVCFSPPLVQNPCRGFERWHVGLFFSPFWVALGAGCSALSYKRLLSIRKFRAFRFPFVACKIFATVKAFKLLYCYVFKSCALVRPPLFPLHKKQPPHSIRLTLARLASGTTPKPPRSRRPTIKSSPITAKRITKGK